MVKQIALSTNGSYQKDFLKVAFLNCSMKGAVAGSIRAPCWKSSIMKKSGKLKWLSKFYQQDVRENEVINPTDVSTNEIYQSGCFKPTYERSNDQLFS